MEERFRCEVCNKKMKDLGNNQYYCTQASEQCYNSLKVVIIQ